MYYWVCSVKLIFLQVINLTNLATLAKQFCNTLMMANYIRLYFYPGAFYTVVLILLLSLTDTQGQSSGKVQVRTLFEDDFETSLSTSLWQVEKGPDASVQTIKGKLVIDSPGGTTVWFRHELSGNIAIEYDWKVVMAGGKNDRLSDLNQFWMASDPRSTDLFTRKGVFETYDSLRLYYVGMGGNGNTTTRFRKYEGNGQRGLLQEYLDKEHLLVANHTYHIKITILNGVSSFWVDGKRFFTFSDKSPLQKGYFGFRSTKSRHEIDNFIVRRLR
jgi:hypothetical protein